MTSRPRRTTAGAMPTLPKIQQLCYLDSFCCHTSIVSPMFTAYKLVVDTSITIDLQDVTVLLA